MPRRNQPVAVATRRIPTRPAARNKAQLPAHAPSKSHTGTPSKLTAAPTAPWFVELGTLLRARNIAAGKELLDSAEVIWSTLPAAHPFHAEMLLMLAQWVDVGYRDENFLARLLDRVPAQSRHTLNVAAYLRVRMAEALHALMVDNADAAISILDIVLHLNEDLLDADLKTLGHLWKGRAHRKQGDYAKALADIDHALTLARTLPSPNVLTAVLQIQQGWILFQRGDSARAQRVLIEAQRILEQTDHWIALGNIESAHGRIVRRNGDYAQAVVHFNRSVTLYERGHPNHPNLARALTNLAFVKRLLALQLRRHIDSTVAGRGRAASAKKPTGLGGLHQQYQELYRSAIAELERAKRIYTLHAHHSGLGSALLNAGHLHLDAGDLTLAAREAAEAAALADESHNLILKARAFILAGMTENAHVEELSGHAKDTPTHAMRAKQLCQEALDLARTTQNKRLLLNAHLALGETAANNFFNDYELAQRSVDAASALLESGDADYVLDDLNALKTKLLRTIGIDDTLLAWSEGIITGKTFKEITEQFAQLVIPRVWLREDRKISRVATRLSMSPQKVRRLVRLSGLATSEPTVASAGAKTNGSSTSRKSGPFGRGRWI